MAGVPQLLLLPSLQQLHRKSKRLSSCSNLSWSFQRVGKAEDKCTLHTDSPVPGHWTRNYPHTRIIPLPLLTLHSKTSCAKATSCPDRLCHGFQPSSYCKSNSLVSQNAGAGRTTPYFHCELPCLQEIARLLIESQRELKCSPCMSRRSHEERGVSLARSGGLSP